MKHTFFFFLLMVFSMYICPAQSRKKPDKPVLTPIYASAVDGREPLWVDQTRLDSLPGPYCEICVSEYFTKDRAQWYAIQVNPNRSVQSYGIISISSAPVLLRSAEGILLVESAVQALNLMHARGWHLQEVLTHSDSSGTSHSYLLKYKTP